MAEWNVLFIHFADVNLLFNSSVFQRAMTPLDYTWRNVNAHLLTGRKMENVLMLRDNVAS